MLSELRLTQSLWDMPGTQPAQACQQALLLLLLHHREQLAESQKASLTAAAAAAELLGTPPQTPGLQDTCCMHRASWNR